MKRIALVLTALALAGPLMTPTLAAAAIATTDDHQIIRAGIFDRCRCAADLP